MSAGAPSDRAPRIIGDARIIGLGHLDWFGLNRDVCFVALASKPASRTRLPHEKPVPAARNID